VEIAMSEGTLFMSLLVAIVVGFRAVMWNQRRIAAKAAKR
jgi:hypothetical protein